MKFKLLSFFALFATTTLTHAADVIPLDFRGDYVGQNESCVETRYMQIEAFGGAIIEATSISNGSDTFSTLVKGAGKSLSITQVQGKFRDEYEDSSSEISFKTLTKTQNGLKVSSGQGKNKSTATYIKCTVDDYKTAVRRLKGIILKKPLKKGDAQLMERDWAISTYKHYMENPPYGIYPKNIQ